MMAVNWAEKKEYLLADKSVGRSVGRKVAMMVDKLAVQLVEQWVETSENLLVERKADL